MTLFRNLLIERPLYVVSLLSVLFDH